MNALEIYNGVCMKNCEIEIFPPWKGQTDSIKEGTLVQVRQSTIDYSVIQIYEITQNQLKFKDNFYNIHCDFIVKVSDKLFQYLIAIKNFQARALIVRNKTFSNLLTKLTTNISVIVSGKILREKDDLNCVVKYIGEVPEYGPGCYVGVMILNSRNLISKLNMMVSRRYINNSPEADLIFTADQILPLNIEDNKSFHLHLKEDSLELLSLFNPTFENNNSNNVTDMLMDVSFEDSNWSKTSNVTHNEQQFFSINETVPEENYKQKYEDLERQYFLASQALLAQQKSNATLTEPLRFNNPNNNNFTQEIQHNKPFYDIDYNQRSNSSMELLSKFKQMELGLEKLKANTHQNNVPPEHQYSNTGFNEQISEQLFDYQQNQHMQFQKSRNNRGNNNSQKPSFENRSQKNDLQSNLGAIPKKIKIPELRGIDYSSNLEDTYCLVCYLVFEENVGVILNECKHSICIPCLVSEINNTPPSSKITCPFTDNNGIKCTNFLKYKGKVNARNQNTSAGGKHSSNPRKQKKTDNNDEELICDNIVRCKNVNCDGIGGFIDPDDPSDFFVCPKCKQYNCLKCKDIHSGMTCVEFKNKPKNLPLSKNQQLMATIKKADNKWDCTKCTFENFIQYNVCVMCGTRNPNTNNIKDKWNCEYCTLENFGTNGICKACAKTNINLNVAKNLPTGSIIQGGNIKEYYRLLELENSDAVLNLEIFECVICTEKINVGDGLKLRGCLHVFCKLCLAEIVNTSEKATVSCPIVECTNILEDREIRVVATEEIFTKHLKRSLQEAKKTSKDGFECRTPDCEGYWVYDNQNHQYHCPICKQLNCIPCQAIHLNQTCKQYQNDIFKSNDPIAIATKQKLEAMLVNAEAMQCPNCLIIITKNGGCNQMYCINCKRGFTWNPPRQDLKKNLWICQNCLIVNNRSQENCDFCKKSKLYNIKQKNETMTPKTSTSLQTKQHLMGSNCSCCNIKLSPDNNFLVHSCYHIFCKNCLLEAIITTVRGPIICPLILDDDKCQTVLKDHLIKSILSEEKYQMYEKRILSENLGAIEGAFFCKKSTCNGWWIIEDNDQVTMYACPICNEFNCVICEAIHTGMSCREYNDRKNGKIKDDGPKIQQYYRLLELEEDKVVTNFESFDCEICFDFCEAGEGITLRDCFHNFCQECLSGTIINSDDAEVRCPMPECGSILQEREIKAVLSEEDFEKFLRKSLQIGQQKMEHGYQCKTPDCKGYWINDENINQLECPICNQPNCLQCQAIHPNMLCNEFQDRIFAQNDPAAQATKKMFEEMIEFGTAMHCPKCNVIIARSAGCDWLQCTMCKTEICWVTKGARWGPNGNGDTSGGCKCRVLGRMCHPKCGNCH